MKLRLTKRTPDKGNPNPPVLGVYVDGIDLGIVQITPQGIKYNTEIIHPYAKMNVTFGTKKKWIRLALKDYLGLSLLRQELRDTQSILKKTVELYNRKLLIAENGWALSESKYNALVAGVPFDLEAYHALKIAECN